MRKQLPETLTLEVSQEDIDAGYSEDCTRCPLARAGNRAVRKLGFLNQWCSMGGDLSVNYRRSGLTAARYTGSPEATAFVAAFDAGDPVVPTTITLTASYRA